LVAFINEERIIDILGTATKQKEIGKSSRGVERIVRAIF
jgi:hypothetical protein